MASKFAYIVGATKSYTPELNVLLNSLDFVGNKQDVHVIGIDLEDKFTSQFDKLNYTVIHHPITEEQWQADKGKSEVVCRKRYWYAAEFGKDYNAVCVLDADLIFVRNPIQFFEIASKTGYILGPCKEQNKVYDDPHHQFNGEWVIPKGYFNPKDLCNCPVFIDAKKHEEALRQSWNWFITGFPNTNMRCPDMDCMNMAFIKYSGEENILSLPGIQWLGTNEQLLKPYIRAVNKRDGKIWTESGIMLYTYHGQFYHEKWKECQIQNRVNCARGYLKITGEADVALEGQARGAMNCLDEYFKKRLKGPITIDIGRDYRHE